MALITGDSTDNDSTDNDNTDNDISDNDITDITGGGTQTIK